MSSKKSEGAAVVRQPDPSSFMPSEEELRHNLERAGAEPGFLMLRSVQMAENGAAEPQRGQKLYFVPYDLGSECPCGSDHPFGECCNQWRFHRPFVQAPDGTVSLSTVYQETWTTWDRSEEAREALGARPDFYIGEESDAACSYSYRAAGRGIGSGLFGTIVLTPDMLEIDALSEARYMAL
ncbi:MAG: hypothetical protein ACOX4G_09115 [Limnochordia bacterium]